ncbi:MULTISPECIES: hypothetical protein [Mycobacteroides]|uniref:hypothetical protein n=1 Tax=Mycobacteroides TaxID=670516 RepID=UPI0008A90D00|nr:MULTISPECIES: hypothetical protein [Mycobacteroides]AYM40391.1 hypothetical protein DYE20_01460 [[Mycobacterium] chelonae subsp. gwanakae]MBE5469501.1 hypothetical protein [Mycobacteroides abscessus]OHU15977.1 hypothetical protein BKG75_13115 [Mycobacteroides chelonae]
MSNTAASRPVIRASTASIAATAEFLSAMFDAPVVITSASDEVATPSGRHLVMIVAETGDAA